jgi:hypothetical protein
MSGVITIAIRLRKNNCKNTILSHVTLVETTISYYCGMMSAERNALACFFVCFSFLDILGITT